ncbi:hypothetical protein FRB95_006420 [Tulasnella sp. JGI-2019a]|nr:hypothetical protein FRB95_006420 [Tulasnella sp. JGI-2019a]
MSLPTVQDTRPQQPSSAGTSYGIISRLTVSSSDVIDHNFRLNVADERSKKIEWTQERTLSETEIIDSLIEKATGRTTWTVHRPIHGWYIKFRSPAFPENFFIPLTPYSSKAHAALFPGIDVSEGSFTFACRTTPIDILLRPAATPPTPSSSHSYPPSPSGSSYPPHPAPSPRDSVTSTSSTATLVENKTANEESGAASSTIQLPTRRPPQPRPQPQSQITHFLITPDPSLAYPLSMEQEMRQQQQGKAHHRVSGLFSSLSQKLVGATKRSFTIRVPSNSKPTTALDSQMFVDRPPAMLTLLTFHDTTPTFTLGSPTSGMLELDDGIARLLGVDRGFYVAVCLAFLQFLEDKQGYIAASND